MSLQFLNWFIDLQKRALLDGIQIEPLTVTEARIYG